MDNSFTNFEKGIRESLEGLKMPYNEHGWSDLENRLDNMAQSGSSNTVLTVLVAASIALMGGLFVYFNYNNAACEALIADSTLKLDRGLNYQGIDSKFQDQVISSDEISKEDPELTPEEFTPVKIREEILAANEQPPVSSINAEATVSKTAKLKDFESKKEDRNDFTNTSTLKVLAFAPSVKVACEGATVDFMVTSDKMEGNYLWNFGDGNFSNAQTPSHTYRKPGVYDISLSVTSEADGQIRSRTVEQLIVINPAPEAEFEFEFVNTPQEEPTVIFRNTSEHANECHWEFDEKDKTEIINPERAYSQKGKHTVKLTVRNEFGCTDSKYKYLTVDSDYNLLAKESFSPNGDGVEDTFIPEALKSRNLKFKFTVYNGKLPVYETTDKYSPWNGSLDGVIANPGSYPWVVIIFNDFGEEEKYYSGTITITP